MEIKLTGQLVGRRVFITGNTGFTGAWLTLLLQELGATVIGFSRPSPFEPSTFDLGKIDELITHIDGDVSDLVQLEEALASASPHYIVHLAAQPIVTAGFTDPYDTFQSNTVGTLNVLEAHRRTNSQAKILVVTTDKVYKNVSFSRAYSEDDPLGGLDPYSSSKAAAEMVVTGYRGLEHFKDRIAVVRGGNILGGGDWSPDRIVPDFARAASSGTALRIRNPEAIRPWQHVLDLAGAYVEILLAFDSGQESLAAQDWNIGPDPADVLTVQDVLAKIQTAWKPISIELVAAHHAEASTLLIDSSKARTLLGWRPRLSPAETIEWTAAWYKAFYEQSANPVDVTLRQIRDWLAR